MCSVRCNMVKKTEQFDKFSERGSRERGQPLDQYLRARKQDWAELKDLDEHTVTCQKICWPTSFSSTAICPRMIVGRLSPTMPVFKT